MSSSASTGRQIRASLDHPVIDSDGHWIEYGPHLAKALKALGGQAALDGFNHFGRDIGATVAMGLEQRTHARRAQEAWWSLPTQKLVFLNWWAVPTLLITPFRQCCQHAVEVLFDFRIELLVVFR